MDKDLKSLSRTEYSQFFCWRACTNDMHINFGHILARVLSNIQKEYRPTQDMDSDKRSQSIMDLTFEYKHLAVWAACCDQVSQVAL